MRNRKQNGQIIRIGDRWYVRYWDRRNVGGKIERKRVTHQLGPITTRGKRPPADIVNEAERHMATVNSGTIPAERIITIGDFVERVYLPWIEHHKRPSTAKGYRDIWEDRLKPLCAKIWLWDTRTYHVQGWLNQIGAGTLSRNTLKHVKSVISGIFTLAKQQDYFQGERTPHATPRSILGLLSLKKPMPTRSTRSKAFSRGCPNPPRPLSQWPRSWVCGTGRFKACCGRTIPRARCTFRGQSGMAA